MQNRAHLRNERVEAGLGTVLFIPRLRRLRQEDGKFKSTLAMDNMPLAGLYDLVRLYLEVKTQLGYSSGSSSWSSTHEDLAAIPNTQ